LRGAVVGAGAPGGHRGLVAPERQRQQLARLGQAFKTFDGNEAINALQLGLQPCRHVQVRLLLPRSRPHLEDDGDHAGPSAAAG
jgi:hypothetical protein